MKLPFFGGVHPDGHKDLSAAAPLAAMPPPARVAIPLRQHIGAPCKPLVSVGDTVCMGQKIGDGEGLCVPVHAPVSGVVVAIEDNKPEAAALLRERMADFPGTELKVLPTRYPQGAEKQLIQAVTGRQVPSGGLPHDVGCAVFNAATAAAVCRAVYEGMPVIERVVTVTGEGVKQPRNLIVRVGASFLEVIAAAGG